LSCAARAGDNGIGGWYGTRELVVVDEPGVVDVVVVVDSAVVVVDPGSVVLVVVLGRTVVVLVVEVGGSVVVVGGGSCAATGLPPLSTTATRASTRSTAGWSRWCELRLVSVRPGIRRGWD
jgi:hypothetical protein